MIFLIFPWVLCTESRTQCEFPASVKLQVRILNLSPSFVSCPRFPLNIISSLLLHTSCVQRLITRKTTSASSPHHYYRNVLTAGDISSHHPDGIHETRPLGHVSGRGKWVISRRKNEVSKTKIIYSKPDYREDFKYVKIEANTRR